MGTAARQSTRHTASAPSKRKAPGRAAPPSRPARQRTASGPAWYVRISGFLLCVLAAAVGFFFLGPDNARRALDALVATVQALLGPVILASVVYALAALRSGRAKVRLPVRRALAGALLVTMTVLALAGAVGTGGVVGNAAWRLLYAGTGAASTPALLVAALMGVVLLGVSVRVLARGAVALLRVLASAVSWGFFTSVGFVVWSAGLMKRAMQRARPRVAPVPVATYEIAEPPTPMEPEQPARREPVVTRTTVEPAPVATPLQPVVAGDWSLPPLTLLELSKPTEVSEVDSRQKARVIEDTLATFGVEAFVREINPGPTVTQFALEPGRGTKVARITSLQHDLALALAAPSIRIEAPVPGQSRVGLEIPNGQAAFVGLRDVMDSAAFYSSKAKLKLALGRDVTGRPIVGDLARMPHLLIAGATGSGKSKCLNSIIAGFLFQHTPDEIRFLMVDPKMVELRTFDGIPHLLWPVVTEVEKVIGILKYAVIEMERRYKELSGLGMRNLDAYNRRMASEGRDTLPHIIVIIDELADLMMAAPEEVETAICRLAQMARAVGIHLIIATQRPSVDVVTGLIKANFPSRIAFAVSSQIDSRVILDMPGAERLLGRGDMLFLGPDSPKPIRVQGSHISDDEIDAVVGHWKSLRPAQYDMQVGQILEAEATKSQNPHEDPLYAQAVELASTHGRLSTSLLQRRLRIGYNRAARLMEALRESGDLDTELDD